MLAPLWLAVTMSFVDPTGAKVTLDQPGMLYMVDFWAEGCGPCLKEMPDLERLAAELEPTGRFKLVSVVWGGWKGAQLTELAERRGIHRPLHADPDGWLDQVARPVFPTKVLVRDGVILQSREGGGRGAYDYWKAAVDRMLAPTDKR